MGRIFPTEVLAEEGRLQRRERWLECKNERDHWVKDYINRGKVFEFHRNGEIPNSFKQENYILPFKFTKKNHPSCCI